MDAQPFPAFPTRSGRLFRRAICGTLVLLGLAAARAEDLTTTDGKTYKAVTVTKVEPDGLSISHEEGTAKVPFTKLPEEVRRLHGYDPEKADAYLKEKRRAELDAMLKASKERETAPPPKPKLPDAYVVSPESAQGITVKMLSRAQFQVAQAERWRLELYSEAEIKKKLAGPAPQGRLLVTWIRPDYESAATEHFMVIVSDGEGKVKFRTGLEYRSPKQLGEGEYTNGQSLDVDELPDEFRVRILDGNQKVYADFVVRAAK
ncbi:hypothetical protein [Haloferula sp. BvORR071]|uniref:hypothetical protein n=1 Tax=Haloferula sp. BvORR071 TaxID=1396141 RepID=UPI000557D14A|nr:hypothetical protein [Haloferula sp. BvORR071]